MSHLSEEQLILHYYGEEAEAPDASRHLEQCAECRALYGSVQRTLNVMDALPVPDPGPEYGARIWRRIQSQVGQASRPVFFRPGRFAPRWRWAAASLAMA